MIQTERREAQLAALDRAAAGGNSSSEGLTAARRSRRTSVTAAGAHECLDSLSFILVKTAGPADCRSAVSLTRR